MNEENKESFDVLGSISQENNTDSQVFQVQEALEDTTNTAEDFVITDDSHIFFDEQTEDSDIETSLNEVQQEEKVEGKSVLRRTYENILFILKYTATSALIFVFLLFTTNYSAYYNVAMSHIYKEDFERKSQSLLNSVEASSLSWSGTEAKKTEEAPKVSLESARVEREEKFNSIENLAAKARRAEVDLWINITPYENRIIIPKIGKNIPMIDIKQKKVNGIDELNNIFMDELENGVIRYPWSAKPWEEWNTFVFGHSSNFPWIEWDYNDVFALLDQVVFDDEVIVYYEQKKYTYKIRKKEIIKPGNVGILKRDKGISELTLMTCWPIGTTLNRMILIWDLVDTE